MKLDQLKNKKILIVGYGVEGKATQEFLKKTLPKNIIGIADQQLDGSSYLSKQNEYDIAIKSPGIHKSKITIPYTTATNIFFANIPGTIIGVTGTKGKSTTASLIYEILKHAGKRVFLLGNITHKTHNIGKPMLTELANHHTKDDIFVCELSSQQLDDIQYAPHIAVFTNFFPEHMDFHGSLEKYWEAKKRIVMFANPHNFFVYNPNLPVLATLAKETKAKSLPFVETLSFPEKIIPLIGQHNNDNVKAAVTVAKVLGVSDKDIQEAIKNYKPLPHRLEVVGTYHDITFVDDAISTTPQSTIKALEAFSNISTLFLGGQDRGYDFTELAKEIVAHKIKNLVLFPDSGEKIYSVILNEVKNIGSSYNPNILESSNMDDAVQFAYQHSPKGSVVMLSTASPSYSIWKNFEEKGQLFKEAVQKYSK